MTPDDIAGLFTRADGTYLCARWSRPIVPVAFGIEETTIATLKGAIEAVVTLARHRMAETDPELGANLMFFFCREWEELLAIPDLDRLVPGIAAAVPKLVAQDANHYRMFRFEADGAIRAAFVFLRMDDALAAMEAETLLLGEAAQVILLWAEGAFAGRSPLALMDGRTILRPEIAAVIRAAYDPVLPAAGRDPAHALRLAARVAA